MKICATVFCLGVKYHFDIFFPFVALFTSPPFPSVSPSLRLTHLHTQGITCVKSTRDETRAGSRERETDRERRRETLDRVAHNQQHPASSLCPGSSSSSQLTSAIIWGPSCSAASECN